MPNMKVIVNDSPTFTELTQLNLYNLSKKNVIQRKCDNPCFSRHQSNILYCIFLFNYLLILALDSGIQIRRREEWLMKNENWKHETKWDVSQVTKTTFGLVIFNLFLWLDLLSEDNNINNINN